MENNVGNTKIKSSKISLAIILLIVIILIASMLGAYAIYTTVQNKNMGVEIAQFNFNVDLKKINNGQDTVVNLADTILGDTTGNVQNGKIAPGTCGAFDLVMDGSSSGVSLDYYININTKVNIKSEEGYLPRNLKFYKAIGNVEDIANDDLINHIEKFNQVGADGSIRITGDIAVTDENKIKSERIYWIWPYETDSEYITLEEADRIDTEDMNNNSIKDDNGNIIGMKEITLPIKVSAEQKTATSKKRLAYMVNVGDIVNYSVSNAEAVGTNETHDGNLAGISIVNGPARTSDVTTWRVLSVEDDRVNLVSDDAINAKILVNRKNNNNEISGLDGYINFVDGLNNVCKIFKNSELAEDARSIQCEDFERYFILDKDYLGKTKYGDKYGETNKNAIVLNVPTDTTEGTTITEERLSKLGLTSTTIPTNTIINNMINLKNRSVTRVMVGNGIIADMLLGNNVDIIKKGYIFATKITQKYNDDCIDFGAMVVGEGIYSGVYYGTSIYRSNGYLSNPLSFGIRPVVTLKSNIKAVSDNGTDGWTISK